MPSQIQISAGLIPSSGGFCTVSPFVFSKIHPVRPHCTSSSHFSFFFSFSAQAFSLSQHFSSHDERLTRAFIRGRRAPGSCRIFVLVIRLLSNIDLFHSPLFFFLSPQSRHVFFRLGAQALLHRLQQVVQVWFHFFTFCDCLWKVCHTFSASSFGFDSTCISCGPCIDVLPEGNFHLAGCVCGPRPRNA